MYATSWSETSLRYLGAAERTALLIQQTALVIQQTRGVLTARGRSLSRLRGSTPSSASCLAVPAGVQRWCWGKELATTVHTASMTTRCGQQGGRKIYVHAHGCSLLAGQCMAGM